jgi:hypothetical protein
MAGPGKVGERSNWPIRTWQFWSGLLAGLGLGLLIGAALVELEWMTVNRKAWVSALGCVIFGVGSVVSAVGAGRKKSA